MIGTVEIKNAAQQCGLEANHENLFHINQFS
jgi:hypothetical protein